MGYSKSKKAISRVEAALDLMITSTENLKFASPNPSELAFYLRQAIFASKDYSRDDAGNPIEPYASYQNLMAKYVIKVVGAQVHCNLRASQFSIIPGEALVTFALTIPDVSDTLEIIGAVLKHKSPHMIFPDASGDTVDHDAIYKFAVSKSYYIVISDNHVTFTKADPGPIKYDPEERKSIGD